MAKRVFDILTRGPRWPTPSSPQRSRASRASGRTRRRSRGAALFARALETPGGLKIQTIHAFCERLLHQFPFEANVAGHFEVLDERGAAALADTARRRVLARRRQKATASRQALATVLGAASDLANELAVTEFIARATRPRLDRRAGSLDAGLRELRRAASARRRRRTACAPRSSASAPSPRICRRLVAAWRGPQERPGGRSRLAPILEATRRGALHRLSRLLDHRRRQAPRPSSLVTNAPRTTGRASRNGSRTSRAA